MKQFNVIFILLFCSFLSCSTKEEATDHKVIVIDIDNIPRASLCDWFETMDFILPEVSESSLLRYYNKIIMYEGNFYILDLNQHTIFVFDPDGKFITNTKGIRGQGPGEYISMVDFDIDMNTGNVHILDPFSRRVRVYTNRFRFIKDIEFPDELLPIVNLKYLGNNKYIFFHARSDKYLSFFCANSQSILNRAMSSNSLLSRFPIVQGSPFFSLNERIFVTHRYTSNDIFEIILEDYSAERKIEFNFLDRTFNPGNMRRNQAQEYYSRYMENNSDKAFIVNKSKNSKYYFVTALHNNGIYIIKIDKEKQTKSLIASHFSNRNNMLSVPVMIDDNYFYTVIDPTAVEYVINELMTTEAKDVLARLDFDSNQIIVRYRFRK